MLENEMLEKALNSNRVNLSMRPVSIAASV
jgi:hypothetical protein